MIIQFHTPKGIIEIDSDTVTDKKLASLNTTRQRLNDLVSRQPRDLAAEIDELKAEIAALKAK